MFKVGDKVRIIFWHNHDYNFIGRIGHVSWLVGPEVEVVFDPPLPDYDFIALQDFRYLNPSWLELVEPEANKDNQMFKVGDRVRAIKKCNAGNSCPQCPPIGYIGRVTSINGSHINLEENDYMALHKRQFELVFDSTPLPLPG